MKPDYNTRLPTRTSREGRMPDEEVAMWEKKLGRRLDSGEKGIWGRPATPEERERLQKFAADYVAAEPERRRRDAETLKRLMKQYGLLSSTNQTVPEGGTKHDSNTRDGRWRPCSPGLGYHRPFVPRRTKRI